ncbi:MAG: hypothetical protein PHC61_00450 [Chitinivibrionales bacterium]|nr:hypothetical protein [Chitinivibrionales bacterium]
MEPNLHAIPDCRNQNYFDFASYQTEETRYFFLEKLLYARIELHLDSGRHSWDEEINLYLSDLMQSLFISAVLFNDKPYLSPFDFDVRKYIQNHPGLRTEYTVYKDNADFGLVSYGVFSDYEHDGSYHSRNCADVDLSGRIGLYYRLAAQALVHLRGPHETLVAVLASLGDGIQEMIALLRKVSGDYFDIMGRITEGSLFHLQKEIQAHAEEKKYAAMLDEFLKEFADYKRAPDPNKRLSLIVKAAELEKLSDTFTFDVESL